MHVSGIKFSGKGEIKHLNLKESDFNYKELLRALKDYRAGGFVICESPNLEEDALLLQSTYNSM
jgi:deoxyribonuclease-4